MGSGCVQRSLPSKVAVMILQKSFLIVSFIYMLSFFSLESLILLEYRFFDYREIISYVVFEVDIPPLLIESMKVSPATKFYSSS